MIHGPLSIVGGVERFNRYLLKFLMEEGFQVELFEPTTTAAPGWARRLMPPLVEYYYVGQRVRAHRDEYALILSTGYAGGCVKAPHVISISFGSVRSYVNAIREGLDCNWRFLCRHALAVRFDRLSKQGTRCVAISSQVQDELRHDYGVESVVIPCGIDMTHFSRRPVRHEVRARYGIRPEAMVGAFVGRWASSHKGLDLLVPIMRARADIHWLIAPGAKVTLSQVSRVTILPPTEVGYDQLPDVYAAADFSVQLSRYESFGFSFVESLACGVPVISTPVGIARSVYDDPVLRDLLINHDPHQRRSFIKTVHAVIDALKEPTYREVRAARGRARVEHEFSLPVWKAKMRELLQSVVKTEAPCRSP